MKDKIKTLKIIAYIAIIIFVIIACDDKEVDDSEYYCDAPTGVKATLLGEKIHLIWDAVPEAKHYEISFRTNMDSETRRKYITTTTDTIYDLSYGEYSSQTEITTLYYYVKTHPRKSGYVASDWSEPAIVNINES